MERYIHQNYLILKFIEDKSGKMILNRNFIEKWLNNLKGYWFNKDIENATSLFKNTTYYQETPFMKPYTTFEEIVKYQKYQYSYNSFKRSKPDSLFNIYSLRIKSRNRKSKNNL